MVTKLETQGKQIFQWGEKFVDIATLEKACLLYTSDSSRRQAAGRVRLGVTADVKHPFPRSGKGRGEMGGHGGLPDPTFSVKRNTQHLDFLRLPCMLSVIFNYITAETSSTISIFPY